MGAIKLKDAIKQKQTITVEKKPALYADVCDCCGKIFKMMDKDAGRMSGIFVAPMVYGNDGKGLGNMFDATVCSFKCADEIMNDGWKKIKKYKPFAKVGSCFLLRCEVKITGCMDEKEIIKRWAKEDHRTFVTNY